MPFTLKILVYGFLLGETDGSQKSGVVSLWKMKCRSTEVFQDLIQCKWNQHLVYFLKLSHVLITYTWKCTFQKTLEAGSIGCYLNCVGDYSLRGELGHVEMLLCPRQMKYQSPFGSSTRIHSEIHLPNLSYQNLVNLSSKFYFPRSSSAFHSVWQHHENKECHTLTLAFLLWCKSLWNKPHVLSFPLPVTSDYTYQRSNFLLLWNNWRWKFWSVYFLDVCCRFGK